MTLRLLAFFALLALLGACQSPQLGSSLVIEAETAELFGSFKVVDFKSASGGKYVTTPQPNESKLSDLLQLPDKQQRIELTLKVPPGNYLIKVWVAARDDSDDSFYVQLDDELYFTYFFDDIRKRNAYPDFSQGYLKDNGGNPKLFSLTEGSHKLSFYLRETGARLDKLELVKN
jgi:hypothetical protein